MLLRAFAFLALLLLTTTCGAGTHDDLRDAVVSLSKDPEGSDIFCTGVAIAPHTVQTQEHCLVTEKIYFDGIYSEKDVVVAKDGRDNVLIYTEQEWKHYVPMSKISLKEGTKVIHWGHPAGWPLTYREGYLATTRFIDEPGFPLGWAYMFDMNIFFGDSGGPVFTEDGKLVCTTSFMYNPTFTGFLMMGCYPNGFTSEDLKKVL